jgi:tetratricopeptide (TPR) repeat protein
MLIIKSVKEFCASNKEIVLPAVLFLLTLILFGRIAFNDFAYDDVLIRTSAAIRSTFNPIYYFTHPYALKVALSESLIDVYRPLGFWFFALQYRLFGFDPFGFHLVSLFLHAANVILFFFLLKKLLSARNGSDALSFAGALLFAVHPLTTETVAWIYQQIGLWAWFFSLLVLNLAFVEESKENLFFTKKWKKIVLLAILSFAAIFSKDHGAVLPLLYILCLFLAKKNLSAQGGSASGGKGKIGEIAAVLLPAVIFMGLRSALFPSTDRLEEIWGGDRSTVFLTMFPALVYYFRLLVWPHPLSVEYSQTLLVQKDFFNFNVIASLVLLSFLALSAIFFWRKRPLYSAGIFWIFIILLPVSNLIVARDVIIAERFAYFIVPGFVLSVLAITILIKKKLLIFLLVAVSLIFGYLTFKRLGAWKNEFTLWRHEVEISPNTWRAEINYGFSLEQNNRTEEAIEHYKKALQSSSAPRNLAASARNLANAYIRTGEIEKAESLLLAVQKKVPDNTQLKAATGKVYLAGKKYKEASEIFKELREKNNKNDSFAFFFILAEKLNGEKDEKIKAEIEKINTPTFRRIAFSLIKGREIMLEEKYSEAILVMSAALITTSSPSPEPYLWLGECYEKIGEKEKALENFETAIVIDPYSIDASQGIMRNGGEIY